MESMKAPSKHYKLGEKVRPSSVKWTWVNKCHWASLPTRAFFKLLLFELATFKCSSVKGAYAYRKLQNIEDGSSGVAHCVCFSEFVFLKGICSFLHQGSSIVIRSGVGNSLILVAGLGWRSWMKRRWFRASCRLRNAWGHRQCKADAGPHIQSFTWEASWLVAKKEGHTKKEVDQQWLLDGL